MTKTKFKDILRAFISDYNAEFVETEDKDTVLLRATMSDLFIDNSEDDDFPTFRSHVVRQYFSNRGVNVSTWDHEKCYFSVKFIKKGALK